MDWKNWKATGITAGALVSVATAWNLLAVPFLNSNYSPVAGRMRVETLEIIQKQTVDTLKETNETVEDVVDRLDRDACIDWNRRFRTAVDALEKAPEDLNAEDLRVTSLSQIFSTPDCMVEPAR